MKLVQYACSHCGKIFEAEDKEILECPGCFWSTTVRRVEDSPPPEMLIGKEPVATKATGWFENIRPEIFQKSLFAVLIFSAAVFVLALGIPPLLQWGRAFFGGKQTFAFKMTPKETDKPFRKGAVPPAPAPVVLSDSEQVILDRQVHLTLDQGPTSKEREILDRQIELRTGVVEKLPSQPWSLENFKQMISEQERFYSVTLPGSYKRTLEKMFKEKYLAAQEVFEAGDLLKARDLWVESLAFPIFANDPRKHRGIVLTMLRAFINDTLSKIGAINTSLAEQGVRQKEEDLSRDYVRLSETIRGGLWREALDQIGRVEKDAEGLEGTSASVQVPPYPASIGGVDADIQRVLTDILKSPAPAVANLNPLNESLREKKKVIEGLLPENREADRRAYQEALDLIARKDWEGALRLLGEIRYVSQLAEDAAEKTQVLRRLLAKGAANEADT
jgi:predicted  nucleic acid-binding Zn-ribbon protein